MNSPLARPSAPSFSHALRHARYTAAKRCLVPFLLGCGVTPCLFAGASSTGDQALSVSIVENTGNSWSLDISNVLTFDPTTGSVNMPTVGTPLTGNWSWGKINVLNSSTGLLDQKDGLNWHSTERNEDNSDFRSNISLYATGNVDPFMSYSFVARNTTTAVQNFSVSFGEAINPRVTGNYRVSDTVVALLTNGVAGTTARISPTRGDLDGDGVAEIQTLSLSGNHGSTFFNGGVDVGPEFTTGTNAGPSLYGPFTSSRTGSAPSLDFWKFDTQFSLTPGRDAVALSGFALINAVAIPEPSTNALLFSAAALVGVIATRRRSRVAQRSE